MIVESAAGRTIAVPERHGRPRPKVTKEEVIVVELPLTAPPNDAWKAIFNSKLGAGKPDGVGWVQLDVDRPNSIYAITFRLDAQEELLAAVQSIDAIVDAATEEWLTLPEVVEAIAKQQRIDQLQERLDRVARA